MHELRSRYLYYYSAQEVLRQSGWQVIVEAYMEIRLPE